jgi:hypothetical protein
MDYDMILDKTQTPDMRAIGEYVEGPARVRWQAFTAFVEGEYGVKPQVFYSVCAGKPGWNVKYKKSGKALCTLYPERDQFIALVVLNAEDMQRFEAVKPAYTAYVSGLYDGCRIFNGTKWLMIGVTDDAILEDVKNLMRLKLAKAGKKS